MKKILYKKLLKFRILFLVNFFKVVNFLKKKNISKIQFIVEKENWAIKKVGISITKNINSKHENLMSISETPEKFQNKVVHFGSHYLWVLKYKY